MGARIRGVIVIAVVLVVGAYGGSALSQWWTRPPQHEVVPAVRGTAPRVGERVRVEVLNGGGRPNMARAATDRLRDAGFDVVDFGNAGSFDRDSSVVLDRTGHLEWARAVADALGITTVISEPDTNRYLDVSVVLGQDWEPTAAPGVDSASDTVPWWDLRRLFRERPGAPPAGGRLADPGQGHEQGEGGE